MSTNTETEFPVGSLIGDYEIMAKLGQGGMGVVYLAQHVFLKKRFALKILSSDLAVVPEFVQVFQHEAQTLAALRHPNIVEVHNFGTHKGHYYLVMEYLDGGTLETYRLREGGHLPPDELLCALRAILSGLRHAHARGIIHRDLKPENFLLDSDGNVKISDFGLACFGKSAGAGRLRPGSFHESRTYVQLASGSRGAPELAGGTEGYVAPELVAGKSADARSDIYALGVTAWHLLTGGVPTDISTAPSKLVPELDTRWDSIIGLCLRANPHERYQSVDEMQDDLDAMAGVARRTFPSWIWAVFVPLLTLIGVGGYLIVKRAVAPPPEVAVVSQNSTIYEFRPEELGKKLGSGLKTEGKPLNIYGWKTGDSVRWPRSKSLPEGTYTASILYSSALIFPKAPVVVSVTGGRKPLRASLPPTRDWEKMRRAKLGQVQVAANAEIVFKLDSAPPKEVETLVVWKLELELADTGKQTGAGKQANTGKQAGAVTPKHASKNAPK